jgi:putative SOS response-associated peptidase YedK
MFTWRQLWKLYQLGTAIPATDLKAIYYVAPSQKVPALRHVDNETEGVMLHWGLVPFFARGVPPKYSTISARVETIETAPSYRGLWDRSEAADGAALKPYPADAMVAWPVSTKVNSPRNNDAELIEAERGVAQTPHEPAKYWPTSAQARWPASHHSATLCNQYR